MIKKSKFAGKVAERIAKIKENVGGSIHLEEDLYEALCIGVHYREDVSSEFEGVEKIQDKITYIFHIPTDDGNVEIKAEYTASAYDKAKLPKILAKFGLDLEEWYGLLGMNIRLSIGEKTSKKGKDYNYVADILKPKKNQEEIEIDKIELPYWFADGVEDDMIDLLDGVSVKEEDKKPKRKIIKSDDESVTDDEFFQDLEEDED